MVRKEFWEPILARNRKTYLRGWHFRCCLKGEKELKTTTREVGRRSGGETLCQKP